MPTLLTAVSGGRRTRDYGRTCRAAHGLDAYVGGRYHGSARVAPGSIPRICSKWLSSTRRRGAGEDLEVQS